MVEKKPEKTLATQAEFSRIVGATRQVISKAVKSGRISNAVRGDKLEIETAVLEYNANKSFTKERGDQISNISVKGIMDRKEAAAYKEHYSALREKVAYERDIDTLVEKAQVIDELFSLGLKIKRTIYDVIRSTKAVDGAAKREALENDMAKALNAIGSSDYYDPAAKMASDE